MASLWNISSTFVFLFSYLIEMIHALKNKQHILSQNVQRSTRGVIAKVLDYGKFELQSHYCKHFWEK